MGKSLRTLAVASVTGLLTAAALTGCTTVTEDPAVVTPGVSDTSISLGVISPFTGVFAAGGLAQLAGINLYWDAVNAAGGICGGRTIDIVSRDSAYDPQKAVTAYSGLREETLAVQLVTATAPTQAIAPLMQQDGVVGITTSSSPAVLEFSNILVPGTPYDVEMVNAVDYLVGQGTLASGDNVGYIYFQGDYGAAGYAGALYGGQKNGITVNPYQIDPTVTDLSSQISDMVAKGSKAIFLSVSPTLLANAAGVSATAGLNVPIIVASPAFVPEVLGSPAADAIANRTIVVSSINAWTTQAASIDALRTLYNASSKETPPQQFIIAGYAAGLVMRTAIEKACADGPLTRASLDAAFSSIQTFDMQDLSVDVSYVDRAAGPAQSTFFLRADKAAEGGLTLLNPQPYEGPNVPSFLTQKG